MNKSSYFIPDKALFGSYPDADAVKELEANKLQEENKSNTSAVVPNQSNLPDQ